jgi:SSS family solute:Na+ symporter
VGLIIAALFAASMGTLSSTMNSTAAIVVNDFYVLWRPAATEAQRLRFARLATLLAGLAAMLTAVYLALRGDQKLWTTYLKLIALIAGGLAGIFGLGLLTRRANGPGVIFGLAASFLITWWVQTHTTVNEFFHIFISVTSSMVLGYGGSLVLGRWAEKKNLAGLNVWDLGQG